MDLLHLGFCILGYILGGIVRLDALLDGIVGITAGITDADLSGLSIGLDLLDEFATTVFRQRRISSPLFSGVMPRGELMIARSISRMIPFSHGVMTMLLASGMVTVPT